MRLSADTTVDLIVQGLSQEKSGSARTDTSFRGLGEEWPIFPGLTLSVARASPHGADQEMETRNPSLVPESAAESRPPAVDPSLHLSLIHISEPTRPY